MFWWVIRIETGCHFTYMSLFRKLIILQQDLCSLHKCIKIWFFDSVTWSSLQLSSPSNFIFNGVNSYSGLLLTICSKSTVNFTLSATWINIIWSSCKFLIVSEMLAWDVLKQATSWPFMWFHGYLNKEMQILSALISLRFLGWMVTVDLTLLICWGHLRASCCGEYLDLGRIK
jgi:hypothetical protein